jgi:hypothetical protein
MDLKFVLNFSAPKTPALSEKVLQMILGLSKTVDMQLQFQSHILLLFCFLTFIIAIYVKSLHFSV